MIYLSLEDGMEVLLFAIFGWKEVYMTHEVNRFYDVKERLNERKIKYKTRVDSGGMRHQSLHSQSMYYIYVKKTNYDLVKSMVG